MCICIGYYGVVCSASRAAISLTVITNTVYWCRFCLLTILCCSAAVCTYAVPSIMCICICNSVVISSTSRAAILLVVITSTVNRFCLLTILCSSAAICTYAVPSIMCICIGYCTIVCSARRTVISLSIITSTVNRFCLLTILCCSAAVCTYAVPSIMCICICYS